MYMLIYDAEGKYSTPSSHRKLEQLTPVTPVNQPTMRPRRCHPSSRSDQNTHGLCKQDVRRSHGCQVRAARIRILRSISKTLMLMPSQEILARLSASPEIP